MTNSRSEARANALARAFCLLDTLAGEGIGHTYGNGQTIMADDAVNEIAEAFDFECEPGWWRTLPETLLAFTEPAAAMPWVPEREAIARVIDPGEWALHDACVERGVSTFGLGTPDSLAKADAILALSPSHSGETGERLREALESGLRALDSNSTPIIRRLARIQIRAVLKGEDGQS